MVKADLKMYYTDLTKLNFTDVDSSIDPNIWSMRGTFQSKLRGVRHFAYELNVETGEVPYRNIRSLRKIMADEVSKETLERGIQLCIDKAKTLVNDAQILLHDGGLIEHITALYIFSLEEYGKALCLRDEIKMNTPSYKIDLTLFRGGSSHKRKLERVSKKLKCVNKVECLEFPGESYSSLPPQCLDNQYFR